MTRTLSNDKFRQIVRLVRQFLLTSFFETLIEMYLSHYEPINFQMEATSCWVAAYAKRNNEIPCSLIERRILSLMRSREFPVWVSREFRVQTARFRSFSDRPLPPRYCKIRC